MKQVAIVVLFTLCLVLPVQASDTLIRLGMPLNIFSGLNPGDAKLTMVQILSLAGFGEHEIKAKT